MQQERHQEMTEEEEYEATLENIPLQLAHRKLLSQYKTQPCTEEIKKEEDEPMSQDVPLHLAQRNVLSHHKTDDIPGKERTTMVIYTEEKEGVSKRMVLFPDSQKVDALMKCREWEWKEDTSTITRDILEKIKEEAVTKIKQESKIKKAISVQPQQCSTSSKQQQRNTRGKHQVKSPNIPEVTGYSDTFDWDHHFNLPPNFTFSRARHYQRMAQMAQMAEFEEDTPLEDISFPFQMTAEELFDKVDGPEEA